MSHFHPSADTFIAVMATGGPWPAVFGPDRPTTAGRLAAILRARRPTADEELRHALAPTTSVKQRVDGYRNGVAWFRENYYEHSDLIEVAASVTGQPDSAAGVES